MGIEDDRKFSGSVVKFPSSFVSDPEISIRECAAFMDLKYLLSERASPYSEGKSETGPKSNVFPLRAPDLELCVPQDFITNDNITDIYVLGGAQSVFTVVSFHYPAPLAVRQESGSESDSIITDWQIITEELLLAPEPGVTSFSSATRGTVRYGMSIYNGIESRYQTFDFAEASFAIGALTNLLAKSRLRQ